MAFKQPIGRGILIPRDVAWWNRHYIYNEVIHMGIKHFLQKHDAINYFQRVIRHSGDKLYREQVLNLGVESEDIFHIHHYGDLNQGKTIILKNSGLWGFFAEYRYMIEICFLADMFGFFPVFHFNDDFYYSSANAVINGTSDCFEHYFMQPCDISYEDAMRSTAVVTATAQNCALARKMLFGGNERDETCYVWDEKIFKKMSVYSKKYLRLNPILDETVHGEIDELLKKRRTLGVHIRIRGFHDEKGRAMDGHPVTAPLSDYIDAIRIGIEQHNFEQIFIATGEDNVLDTLEKIFPGKLVYYRDVLRKPDGNTHHIVSDRQNNKYRLGYEVLRDMLTLTKCDGLIAGLSQVAFSAMIKKYESGLDFEFKKIFNLGINHTNYLANDHEKRQKKKIQHR